jgi:S-formylglutathione hydrolase
MTLSKIENRACFGGWQQVWSHLSPTLGCTMKFAIYLPPQAASQACPSVYWLSGLTCTEQNFITKAGAQQFAAAHGVILVVPDTGPRGDHVANHDGFDLGQGASFYLDATEEPWRKHYQMESYLCDELPELIAANFAATEAKSIMGHSMGGHGALVLALRNPGHWQSVSAFSPIVAPSQVPWGQKALAAYMGEDRRAWPRWDACALIANASERLPLLVDQGTDDEFLARELRPELLQEACDKAGHPLTLRMQPGYDHSYYFIASFIGDHIAHHAAALAAFAP